MIHRENDRDLYRYIGSYILYKKSNINPTITLIVPCNLISDEVCIELQPNLSVLP
jgi:hypothetical protein